MRTDYPATWFRLYAEFATDPKVQMLSEIDQRRFVMLLCMRCCNGCVTLRETEVAFQLRVTGDEWATTKANLVDKGLIDLSNKPTAWDKRQRSSDTSAERVAKHRALHKRDSNNSVTLQKRTVETETETENKKTTPMRDSIPYQKIVDSYHERLTMCPRVNRLSNTRKGHVKARWHTDLKTINEWHQYFETVSQSLFLTGRVNGTREPFFASFDWLINESNMLKVLEGKYANKSNSSGFNGFIPGAV